MHDPSQPLSSNARVSYSLQVLRVMTVVGIPSFVPLVPRTYVHGIFKSLTALIASSSRRALISSIVTLSISSRLVWAQVERMPMAWSGLSRILATIHGGVKGVCRKLDHSGSVFWFFGSSWVSDMGIEHSVKRENVASSWIDVGNNKLLQGRDDLTEGIVWSVVSIHISKSSFSTDKGERDFTGHPQNPRLRQTRSCPTTPDVPRRSAA